MTLSPNTIRLLARLGDKRARSCSDALRRGLCSYVVSVNGCLVTRGPSQWAVAS
jgi:hypothetical protein